MADRGRVSKAEIEIKDLVPKVLEKVDRPPPPANFDAYEADIWYGIVNSMPSDWFTTPAIPLLTQYVRHVVTSETIAQMIRDMLDIKNKKDFSLKSYRELVKTQKEESMVLASLATKLRISQQATINKRGNQIESAKLMPWELGAEEE